MRRPRIWNRADTDPLRTARTRTSLRAGRTGWYRITNTAGDNGPTTEVYIYDEIGWFGVTAQDLIDNLQAVTAPSISLRLNTPGGDVFDGIAIHNALRSHPATVNVIVDALAASIGSVIAMAGDSVAMAPGSQIMIHDASTIEIGNAADMRKMADLLDQQSDNIAGFYQRRAGGTVADWRARMQAETWYMADEAVTAGLADSILDAPAPDGDPVNTWDLSIYRFAGRDKAPAPAPVPVPPSPPQPAANPWDEAFADLIASKGASA